MHKFYSYDWHYSMNIVYNLFKNITWDDLMDRYKSTFVWTANQSYKENEESYQYENWAKCHKEG